MRNVIYMFFFITITSCSVVKNNENQSYRVVKIQKEKSWCILYARSNNKTYKIFSKYKENSSSLCKKIKVGIKYDFKLKTFESFTKSINGVSLKIPGYTGCYDLGEIVICLEPKKGIWDLYVAEELNGEYYCKGSGNAPNELAE